MSDGILSNPSIQELLRERDELRTRVAELEADLASALPLEPHDDVVCWFNEVDAEIARAQAKFPGNQLATIALMEEVGELAKAVLDEPSERARAESVQVACMAYLVAVKGDRCRSLALRRAAAGLDPLGDAGK